MTFVRRLQAIALVFIVGLAALGSPAEASGALWKIRSLHKGPPAGGATVYLLQGADAPGAWTATSQPADVGTGSVNTMARVDQVPYQTLNAGQTLYFSVLAFHSPTSAEYSGGITNAISSVTASCDNYGGGTWQTLTAETSPLDGAPVWAGTIRAADFTDGNHECRVIATPTNGTPRLLPGFYFYANGGGSFTQQTQYVCGSTGNDANAGTIGSPKATVSAAKEYLRTTYGNVGGHKIEISCAGNYNNADPVNKTRGAAQTQWLTITPSAGLTAADVIFNAAGYFEGLDIDKVRWKGVGASVAFEGGVNTQSVWWDHVTFIGPDPNDYTAEIKGANWGGVYLTDSTIDYSEDGCDNCGQIRNTTFSHMTNNMFEKTDLIVNVTVDHLDELLSETQPGGQTNHTDLFASQSNNNSSNGYSLNQIAWGVTVNNIINSQVLFCDAGGDWADTAWVNMNVGNWTGYTSMNLGCPTNNLFMKDVTIGGTVDLSDADFTATDTVFINVTGTDDHATGTTAAGLSIYGGNMTKP